jgi:hypothetical protein
MRSTTSRWSMKWQSRMFFVLAAMWNSSGVEML